jgi:ATP-dependent DNA helicase RecQ
VPDIRAVARDRFGFEELREGQEPAIRALLDGRDVLAVMPTGSGKSAIYQIAGVLLGGTTVVVSPLIALQRDQVGALAETDTAAAELNSTLSEGKREQTLADAEDGQLDYLFLAPEQFGNEETTARLRDLEVALLVVDEAHCISEWGHDFRPDYLRLGAVVEALGHPRVLALTATAAPPVRSEIVERLGMADLQLVVHGFDRPNIWLGVEEFHEEDAQREALVERTAAEAKPGIVYVATRRDSEEIAAALEKRGVRAAAYHAGLAAARREQTHDAFTTDEIDVVVATIAFGMGIDKPNVRFVFHAHPSQSIDAYYQEIGRAGRDGERADAILFYRGRDIGRQRFFGGGAKLELQEVEAVSEAVAAAEASIAPEALRDQTALSDSKLTRAVARLEEVGAVDILATGEIVEAESGDRAAAQAFAVQERFREYERSRVEMVRAYAELRDCRREFLLNYFGEPRDEPCGFCDNCERGRVVEDGARPFELASRVRHDAWGEGLVERYEGDKMVVLFDGAGYKTLDVELVLERDLLEPIG